MAMLLTTTHTFRFSLRTGYGDSTSYLIVEGGSQFQGGCQVNGSAPAFCLGKSRILLNFMNKLVN